MRNGELMQRKNVIFEYLSSLGHWAWFLIADAVGIIQGILWDIPYIQKIPFSAWVILFILFLIIANFHAFYKISNKRDELLKIINSQNALDERLKLLAELRTMGVKIRNWGMSKKHKADIDKLINYRKKWKEVVIHTIDSISPAQAEVFKTLDKYIIQYNEIIPSELLKRHLSMFDTELNKLKELVENLEPRFKDKH